MNKKDLWQFEDFIAYEFNYIEWYKRTAGQDTIISKEINRKGKHRFLIARFDGEGRYLVGVLADEQGHEVVNGNGRTVAEFMELCKAELKAGRAA